MFIEKSDKYSTLPSKTVSAIYLQAEHLKGEMMSSTVHAVICVLDFLVL